MWDQLPPDVAAHILWHVLSDLRAVCSLRGALLIRLFGLSDDFWAVHSCCGLRTLDAIERARRVGVHFCESVRRWEHDAMCRRAVVWHGSTFVFADGTARWIAAIDRQAWRCALVDAVDSDHPHATLTRWMESTRAWQLYEAKALGDRYVRHRLRKRLRAREQPWAYESSSDSGSEWYASDDEGRHCIELHATRGTTERTIEAHVASVREGKRLVLQGVDDDSLRYARLLRELAYAAEHRAYRHSMVILPLACARALAPKPSRGNA